MSESRSAELDHLRQQNEALRTSNKEFFENTLRLINAIDTVMHLDCMKPLRSVSISEALAFTELGFARRAFDLDLEQSLDGDCFLA